MAGRAQDELPEFVKILRPYAELYAISAHDEHKKTEALREIIRRIAGLTKPQVEKVLAAAKECTPTNCWWATYEVARFILLRWGTE